VFPETTLSSLKQGGTLYLLVSAGSTFDDGFGALHQDYFYYLFK
jgi:hypothetical protein